MAIPENRPEPAAVRPSACVAMAALIAACALALTGCGSSSGTPSGTGGGTSSGTQNSATHTSTTDPSPSPLIESNPPGDIPDNQAFVPYTGVGYRVVIPEGWARSTTSAGVMFTDKYNSITITTAHRSTAPTPASARSREVPAIKTAAKRFTPGAVTTVHRTAGRAVLITYHALSPVNSVTGKVANEAVERYEFWRAGLEVILTLAAPVGSDNVDPWRKITDSFTWAGK